MTAYELMKICFIVLYGIVQVINLIVSINAYKHFNDFMGAFEGFILGILMYAVILLMYYGFGCGFVIALKWILGQFGIVAVSDTVYAVIYMIFAWFSVGMWYRVRR